MRRTCSRALRRYLCLAAILPVCSFSMGAGIAEVKPNTNSAIGNRFRNTLPGVPYSGSAACAKCHKAIFNDYNRTPMGRSMGLPANSPELSLVTSPITVFDQTTNRYFQIFRSGSGIYQSEFQLDSSGAPVFRETEQIEYVLGAGVHGVSYVIRRQHFLFEAPLSFYSKTKTWALSPGYKSQTTGFARPILPGCIYCHSGHPQPAEQGNGQFRNPPFQELAVGCERCHGPGQLHVAERMKGLALSGVADDSIVNPAKLSGWLADNICMSCHEFGDARVLRPGMKLSDFRPGTPLDDSLAIFTIPSTDEAESAPPLLGYYSAMIASRCYTASGKRLHCITCHDPHQLLPNRQAAAYYENKCLTCHTVRSCRLPLRKRLIESTQDNCVRCHMPSRDVAGINHAMITDHRITALSGEAYQGLAAQRSTVPARLILLDAIPGKREALVPPLVLLQAYHAILHARSEPGYKQRYLALLERLSSAEPDNVTVMRYLGEAELAAGTPQAAENALRYFSRAIRLGSELPSDYILLAELLVRSGKLPAAIELLKRGMRLAPFVPEYYGDLAVRYWQVGNYAAAKQTAERGLQLFPGDPFLRHFQSRIRN
jgi:tetratricopeptide (TPR) repeat protein